MAIIHLAPIHVDEDVVIYVDEQNRLIQVNWLRHTGSEGFRNNITLACTYAVQHHLDSWLCNMQHMQYLEVGDQNWLVRKVFPEFKGKFKLHFAYVVTHNGLETMATFRIHELVKQSQELSTHIDIDIFVNMNQARNWLLNDNGL